MDITSLLMALWVPLTSPSFAPSEAGSQGTAHASIKVESNHRTYKRNLSRPHFYTQTEALLSVSVVLKGEGLFAGLDQGVVADDETVPDHSTLQAFPQGQEAVVKLSVEIPELDVDISQRIQAPFTQGSWESYNSGQEVSLAWEVPPPLSLEGSGEISWSIMQDIASQVREVIESWAPEGVTFKVCWEASPAQSQKVALSLGPEEAFISGPYPSFKMAFQVSTGHRQKDPCPLKSPL